MSVTTTGPVNPQQIISALGGGIIRIDGDPAQAGAIISSGQYTDTQISTALAGITYDANFGIPATLASNIEKHLTQLETWLTNNPNGATLTAAQTAMLARMLVGLGRLTLGLVSSIGQAS